MKNPLRMQIFVQVQGKATRAVCNVCDEGPGLNQEDQVKLFQLGVRLSSAPTGDEPSNGYGLAVAKELVDKLGGEPWHESAPGGRPCFSFRRPVYQEQE
jgi:two-component system OmpR family sensor kinase